MTLVHYLNSQISAAQELDFFLRILIAAFCGLALGTERSRRFKEAGVRTHMIVCCAAALIMIISKYGFSDMILPDGSHYPGANSTDPARLAAQVISGVGFLGAGMIFQHGASIRGLTTAAGIWATAGIGLALGAGMIWIGIFSTVLIAITQILMHRIKIGSDSYKSCNLEILAVNTSEFHGIFNALVKSLDAQIVECRITREEDNCIRYNANLKAKNGITPEDINNFLGENQDVRSVSVVSIV